MFYSLSWRRQSWFGVYNLKVMSSTKTPYQKLRRKIKTTGIWVPNKGLFMRHGQKKISQTADSNAKQLRSLIISYRRDDKIIQNEIGMLIEKCEKFHENPDENKYSNSLLHLAAQFNLEEELFRNLAKKISIQSDEKINPILLLNRHNYTPLASAASANSVEIISTLIKLEKEATAKTKQSSARNEYKRKNQESLKGEVDMRIVAPLIAALRSGSLESAELIVREGFYFRKEVDEFGRNPIHWASALGFDRILEELLNNKLAHKFMNEQDDNGFTPILLALRENQLRCVKILLQYGSKINYELSNSDYDTIKIEKIKGNLSLVKFCEDASKNLEPIHSEITSQISDITTENSNEEI